MSPSGNPRRDHQSVVQSMALLLPEEQAGDGGLAGPRVADDGGGRARRHLEAHPLQALHHRPDRHVGGQAPLVSEGDRGWIGQSCSNQEDVVLVHNRRVLSFSAPHRTGVVLSSYLALCLSGVGERHVLEAHRQALMRQTAARPQ